MPDQIKPQDQNSSRYKAESFAVFGVVFEIGFIVALPLLALGYAGKYLDRTYGKHYFIYVGIGLAVLSTVLWFYRRFRQMVASLRRAANQKPLDDNNTNNSNPENKDKS